MPIGVVDAAEGLIDGGGWRRRFFSGDVRFGVARAVWRRDLLGEDDRCGVDGGSAPASATVSATAAASGCARLRRPAVGGLGAKRHTRAGMSGARGLRTTRA